MGQAWMRILLKKISRFEPLNHPGQDIAKTLRAFLPLRVSGAGGADGEMAGIVIVKLRPDPFPFNMVLTENGTIWPINHHLTAFSGRSSTPIT
jgi:hypothetical protein